MITLNEFKLLDLEDQAVIPFYEGELLAMREYNGWPTFLYSLYDFYVEVVHDFVNCRYVEVRCFPIDAIPDAYLTDIHLSGLF